MTITFIDGFDLADDSAAALRKGWAYAEGPGIDLTASKWGGRCWDLGQSPNDVLSVGIGNYLVKYKSVSFWRKYQTLPTGNGAVCFLGDGPPNGITSSSASHFAIWTNTSNGDIRVTRAAGAAAATVPNAIQANVWQHWEVRIYVTSGGTIEIWLDGIKILDLTGLDTIDNTSGGAWTFAGSAGTTKSFIDDVVVSEDAIGVQPLLGISRIQTLLADGDSANTAWTGSSTDVDDPLGTSDGDTTFASSPTLNAKQDYTFGDLADTPATIHAVATQVEFRKDDAGTMGVTPYINSNATEAAGAEHGAAEAYIGRQDIHPLNPDGSVSWTAAAVNAVIAGHEITAV